MSAWEMNAPEDGFDIEAGTPEVSVERSSALHLPERDTEIPAMSPIVSPGLIGVATLSLVSPPRETGICRCSACLSIPDDIDELFK